MPNYVFTNRCFDVTAKSVWDTLIPQINPSRVLEVGQWRA